MPRQTAESCTVFSLDAVSYIGELQDVTVNTTIGDEDGAAINEIDMDACPISREWTLTGSCFVDAAPKLVAKILSGDPVVTVILTINGNSYGGTGLLSTASHETRRKALQKQSFTVKAKGALTLTLAGGGG